MKPFLDRLEELKEDLEKEIQNKMIFLLNPKDTKILEAIIAWTSLKKKDFSLIQVQDDANMEDLWDIADPDIMQFSIALGCPILQANPRLEQLKALGIIYPDGSIPDLASSIITVYIKGQVGELKNKSTKYEDD